ncbi:hypothetical protein [Pantoea dispersa]|uniref:Uncharacterized protein n=1 Tax=Pantoea dispersa TaxID=59814 RepID=A0A8E1S0L5_9GAMM|nr:hypothetical protein [Pantoea dispersa]KTR90457.1 hypothetical protein SA2_10790 [Pantoea dispersa]KTS22219.1 hypothetical protein SA4R_11190 [Pantoea dispersa]KTS57165.1 hypothetical protein SA5R_18585 [Pantoea dispersa]KTS68480.1 hypothetical protein SA3R_07195 [Pantoea dispersa]
MTKFNMQIKQNYASFFFKESDKCVIVDSFDNQEFDVRVGTIGESKLIGTVNAYSDEELNEKLERVTADYI